MQSEQLASDKLVALPDLDFSCGSHYPSFRPGHMNVSPATLQENKKNKSALNFLIQILLSILLASIINT